MKNKRGRERSMKKKKMATSCPSILKPLNSQSYDRKPPFRPDRLLLLLNTFAE